MYRIFIVEDDETIASLLSEKLRTWGYDTETVRDFSSVSAEALAYDPHLVLLDIKLPFYNGFHWCQMIRKESAVPIVFLSSASDNMNIVMAMNMGGDDFIAKPFDMDVLIAKIQAILRRTYDMSKETRDPEYRGLTLKADDQTAVYENQTVELTRNEFKIMSILMSQPGKIISRDEMMQKLWQTNEFVDDNTLTVNVTRLRRKLEQIGLSDFIITRKGVGYMI
ncbi:MAG TPA: DNA-binding response regulator [Erysipelotrichaceae bacterium]|nr:DNA-binding response regulator [Erysipelotrichaceae bacterium]